MFLAPDLLFVYVLGGNVCNVFKCMLPSGNRDESQKTTAGSLKNSSQGFWNHIKTYWFIGYTIVEYCEAHGAWGMMNFRWDFIGSPGIRKLKWLLYPVQQTVCTGFRQVLLSVTSKDSWLYSGCTSTFPTATEGSFSCQQNFTLHFSMKI